MRLFTDVGYGRVGKARSADDVTKMYDEQLDFYMAQPEDRLYTGDMNKRIQEGAQGPGFAEGGEVVVDEETGMMDYLTDNPLYNNVIKPIEEARDDKTEEYDLENNPQRVLPVIVGEALELPGEIQMQFQEIIEARTAEKIVEMTEEMIAEEQEYLESENADPLIELKQQEINLKAMDNERKKNYDEVRLGLDQAKLQQTADLTQDKIDSQEDIAQLRANVNLEKANTPRKEKIQKDVNFED